MSFWLFMLAMNLLIPLTMIVFGLLFFCKSPKRIHGFFGYRTARSMRSPAAWHFAHRYFGRLWLILGAVLLPLSAAAMFCVLGKDADAVGIFGGGLCLFQCLPMCLPIPLTERALKRTFG